MKLRLSIHDVRHDQRVYRIATPRVAPTQLTVHDGRTCFLLRCDRATALQLAAIWEFAWRSPGTIIYVPARKNPAACCDEQWRGVLDPLDLVLVHHKVQLRPSAWPRLHAMMRRGRLHTAKVQLPAETHDPLQRHRRLAYHDNLDRFVHHVHAQTLFLTGSTPVFADTATRFASVASHPAEHPGHPANCAEFDIVDKPRWPADVTELFIGHTESWPLSSHCAPVIGTIYQDPDRNLDGQGDAVE